MKKKLAYAYIIAALALFVLIGVMISLILGKGEDYSKIVLSQQGYSSTVIPFKRGTIMDRNQTVLAASEQVYNLILDPSVINQGNEDDIEATIEALVNVFGYPREEVEKAISETPASAYLRYEKEMTDDRREAFETYQTEHNNDEKASGKITGVWFEPEYRRVYPYDTLACTVMGFSGADSTKGNWGLEQYYNDILSGTNGRSYGYVNADGSVDRTTKEPVDGATIVTTIDYSVQRIVENAIADFMKENTAENVAVLVMDPRNAEILALASNDVFDLNDPNDLTHMYTEAEISAMSDSEKSDARNGMWRNFAISDSFEPGSTAKVITTAAALEENLAEGDSIYDCDGGEQVVDRYIRCSHTHHELDFVAALGKSCNDVMMQLAKKMGKTVFCGYQDLFGFGRTTGVDLPGESAGILYSEEDMSQVDLATNSFGQNYTCTMIQMAAAYCSILNGGAYYRPHIVKQIINSDGDILQDFSNTVVKETVSSSSAEVLKKGLEMVVTSGTGKDARIRGYSVGGKTGTAEKYPRGSKNYVLSFIGFTPVESPELLVYVVVDNAKMKSDKTHVYTVKETAVPLERKIMVSLLDYLNVTPAMITDEETGETQPAVKPDENGRIDHGDVIEPLNDSPGQSEEDDDADDEMPEGGFMDGEDKGPPKEPETDPAEAGEAADAEAAPEVGEVEDATEGDAEAGEGEDAAEGDAEAGEDADAEGEDAEDAENAEEGDAEDGEGGNAEDGEDDENAGDEDENDNIVLGDEEV